MFKLIVVLAVFYGIAVYFKVRRKVILTTLALVYGFVLFLVLVLPETHFVNYKYWKFVCRITIINHYHAADWCLQFYFKKNQEKKY